MIIIIITAIIIIMITTIIIIISVQYKPYDEVQMFLIRYVVGDVFQSAVFICY